MNENWCDLQETCYHAGFILCRFPGLYQAAIERMYFLWDKEKEGFLRQKNQKFLNMLHIKI